MEKVYYKILNNNSTVINDINTAISHYRTYTNLKFIPVQTEKAKAYITDYIKSGRIEFVNANENKSYVGMINSTVQNIWLDARPGYLPSAIHEIGHAIGLMHEHSRSDRDNYIIVDTTNVEPKYRHNFYKNEMEVHYPTNALDFRSIMMYPPDAFAIKTNIPVIKKIDGSAFTEYQRKGLSPLDQVVIISMYPMVDAEPDIMIYDQKQPTANSCELKGELIYEGRPSVTTQYGIRITKVKDGVYKDQYGTRINNQTACVFTCQFTDLEPNTKYSAKAYAIQNSNYVWSKNEIDFTTKPIPVIAISNTTSTSATATVTFDAATMLAEYEDKGTPIGVNY